MESVILRKSKVILEISDLKGRIHTLKAARPVDIVVIRALALKVIDLQNELNVIEVILH